jgi:hypothetical protein
VQNSSSDERHYWANTLHAYLLDASTVRIERVAAGASVRASYAVVEFTGSNWSVQTRTHTFAASGQVETESITPLAGTDKAFLITQHRTSQNGLDEYGYQGWISAFNEVSFQLRQGASNPETHEMRFWVVENDAGDFLVRRGDFTIPDSDSDDEQIHNETITAVADLGTTGITFNHDTDGGGRAFPRACRIARLTSTTNLEVYCSRGNQPSDCRYETIEFPSAPDRSNLLIPCDNFTTSDLSPPFSFNSTDPNGDDVIYQIQIDIAVDFPAPVLDDSSDSPAWGTFTNAENPPDTSPFIEGETITYVPSIEGTHGVTYYWRVRARDPAGSNDWGAWSDVYSLTLDTTVTTPSWRQTNSDQWNNPDNPSTFVNTRTNASEQVELISPKAGTVYSSNEDGILFNGSPRTDQTSDYVGKNPANMAKGYIVFDLSSVAAIDAATITVNVDLDNIAAGQNVELHQVDWGPTVDASDWDLFNLFTLVQSDFIVGTDGDDSGPHTSIDITPFLIPGTVNYFGLKGDDVVNYYIRMYFGEGGAQAPRLDWSFAGNESGYVMSAPIPFSGLAVAGSEEWDQLQFAMSGGDGGTLVIKLYYDNGGTPVIVPDADLPGNASGFDTSPVDISALDTATYHTLYIRGEFAIGSDPPNLDGWDITGGTPTAVDLADFRATGTEDGTVAVTWQTAQEIDNVGFNLYRSSDEDGGFYPVNDALIPGLLSSAKGKSYVFVDETAIPGRTYYYMLEDIDLDGVRTMHGPATVDWVQLNETGESEDNSSTADPLTSPNNHQAINGIPVASPALLSSGSYRCDGTSPRASENGLPVTLEGFNAYRHAGGVALEWKTGRELDNVGFHLYREVDGRYYRITPQIIAGSLFSVGAGNPLIGGQSYRFWDPMADHAGAGRYWLEYTHLKGFHAYFGPIEPQALGHRLSEQVAHHYRTLSARLAKNYQDYWKAQQLHDYLRTLPVEGSSPAVAGRRTEQEYPETHQRPVPGAQETIASHAVVKILVNEEGWYRVEQSELVAAGLNPYVDPDHLKLFADGREQAILVNGAEDGWFDPEDSIEFYGVPLDTPWTDEHVYWLVAGVHRGKRVHAASVSARRTEVASFPYTVEVHDNTMYFAALKNGDDDNFFGAVVTPSAPVDQLLHVVAPELYPPENALLEVTVQGATDVSHNIALWFNDIHIGDVVFDGQEQGRLAIPIPRSWLLNGDNVLTLQPQGDSTDITVVDKIRLTYWRTYTADDSSLQCTATGGRLLIIDGFLTDTIRLMDVTDPTAVVEATGTVTGAENYSVRVGVPGVGSRDLLAFTEDAVKAPIAVIPNYPSAWRCEESGADVVIISHGDFLEPTEALASLRERQGWTVALVDVEDLYDEYNFGAKTPYAIRDFLQEAYELWDNRPRYVLLVGDATFDPRNYLGFGDLDFLPTKIVETTYLETACDDWYADIDEDGVADMALGRLPVVSREELDVMIEKILVHEDAVSGMNEILLVADANDSSFDFESACYGLAEELPTDLDVYGIFRGQVGTSTAHRQILDMLNQGPLLVDYLGHGSVEMWHGNLLTSSDARSLTNYPRLPVFVSMTCLNGMFHDLYTESMAEALLRAPFGGAVAVWASSGLTLPHRQSLMNRVLLHNLFSDGQPTLGDAALAAKGAISDRDIRNTWILFGDPMTRIW